MQDPVPDLKAGRREWIGLAVLALPTLLLSLDASVLYLALPTLSADLGADSTEQLWMLDIYSFLLAGFLVTMGTLGDRIGRRRLLLIGGAAFGAVSVLAAYSTSPEMLIACRALLGVAGATLMPSTMALIRNMFHDPAQMSKAIGLWYSCFMAGLLLGPLVGGVLLDHFWWGSAFLLGVPVMLLLVVAAPVLLPEYRDPSAGRLDLASVALSLATILPVIWGLKQLARSGWATAPLLAMVAGVLVGVAFVRRQRQLAHPLLDLKLFRLPAFSGAISVMLTGGIVMAGVSFQLALYLQVVEGMSPLRAGLWLIPQNVAMIVGFTVAPRIAKRFRTSVTVAGGLVLCATGLLVMTQGSLGLLIGGMTLTSFGMSLPMTLTANLMLSAAPPERAGSASALSETSAEGGIAVGIATLGSIGTLVYGRQLELPAGLPADVAATARQSVTGAIGAAHQLPGSLGADLAAGAKAAFTSGLQVVLVVGAVAFLACAALAARLLRQDIVQEQESAQEVQVP